MEFALLLHLARFAELVQSCGETTCLDSYKVPTNTIYYWTEYRYSMIFVNSKVKNYTTSTENNNTSN